jgi:thymidine kinase
MSSKKIFNGSLNLIIGPMYSGKTSTLITRYNRHKIAKRKCIMIKYKNDTRYDDKMLVTHNGIKVQAIPCEELADVDLIVKKYDVVCVDEVQFYKDAHIFCDKWANEGLIVEACGLNGTFERKPFKTVSLLIPKCNNLTYITAICRETSREGVYSKRNTNETKLEIIGGTDIYSATDRETYFKGNKNWLKLNFIDYAFIFCKKRDIKITDELLNKIKNLQVNNDINFKKSMLKLTSNS